MGAARAEGSPPVVLPYSTGSVVCANDAKLLENPIFPACHTGNSPAVYRSSLTESRITCADQQSGR
eukprot:1175846-Prorocentrum_minimum.AAC.3